MINFFEIRGYCIRDFEILLVKINFFFNFFSEEPRSTSCASPATATTTLQQHHLSLRLRRREQLPDRRLWLKSWIRSIREDQTTNPDRQVDPAGPEINLRTIRRSRWRSRPCTTGENVFRRSRSCRRRCPRPHRPPSRSGKTFRVRVDLNHGPTRWRRTSARKCLFSDRFFIGLQQGWPDYFSDGPNFIKILFCGPQTFLGLFFVFVFKIISHN